MGRRQATGGRERLEVLVYSYEFMIIRILSYPQERQISLTAVSGERH
jgi:hypothetical protein